MTTAQDVKTSVTVNNNSVIQNYVHPGDHTQPTYEMTSGFKPFTEGFLMREEGVESVPVKMNNWSRKRSRKVDRNGVASVRTSLHYSHLSIL